MERLLVLGTSALAPDVADTAQDAGFEVAGFVENLDPRRCDGDLDGLPVYWIDDVASLRTDHLAVCGLATTKRHTYIEQARQLGLRFATVIHPTARVSTKARIGEGSIIGALAAIAAHAEIGEHVLVNRGSLIGHHTKIGNFCSLQPGSNVAGLCNIAERVWMGMASVVVDRVSIGMDSLIGAGAVVTEELPSNVMAVGVPARIVDKDFRGR